MEYRIEILAEKKLVGKRIIMTFSDNKTGELWKNFMPGRKEIRNNIGTELYSMQLYAPTFFDHFNPDVAFEKWATMEVTDFESIPAGMLSFTLPGGLYAVFSYKGAASNGGNAFQYILGSWLPISGYQLDNRPHFEVLGEKYKNEDPESEEEIWIPVKRKK
jgi:AraC family transcriptional regulator